MTLLLEAAGVVRAVQVRRDGRRFRIAVDGREHLVDAVELEPGRWSLLLGPEGRSVEVRVRSDRAGGCTVFPGRGSLPVTIVDARREARRAAGVSRAGAAAASGDGRITAPMPGKVVRVLVAAGERVAARQALVVVEAMKMENELRSPRDGTVLEVLAREGASVEAGAPLLTIG